MIDSDIEKVWEEFWKPLIEKDGLVDLDQVKKELFDYRQFMDTAAEVYMHVTGDRISKINTTAAAIIGEADDITRLAIEEAEKEWTCSDCNERYRSQQDETRSKGEHFQEGL